MRQYTVDIAGLRHTFLYDEAEAKRLGLTPDEPAQKAAEKPANKQASAPANKARKARNKAKG